MWSLISAHCVRLFGTFNLKPRRRASCSKGISVTHDTKQTALRWKWRYPLTLLHRSGTGQLPSQRARKMWKLTITNRIPGLFNKMQPFKPNWERNNALCPPPFLWMGPLPVLWMPRLLKWWSPCKGWLLHCLFSSFVPQGTSEKLTSGPWLSTPSIVKTQRQCLRLC